ncbi:MAG: sigma-70 family RNA polymerase sigma factor, partial [Methyloligellaceae bacterium]
MLPPFELKQAIDKTVREEWGRILASLVKTLGDLELAEDCLQEAVVAAIEHWNRSGLPQSPAGWLIVTARRKAIDRIRRDKNFAAKAAEISYLLDLENRSGGEAEIAVIPDKRLELIFTCCHPALEEKSRLALTLRTLGGLTTEEIARAFLDKPETMAQRLVRAK